MGINQWQRREILKENLRFVLGAQLRDRQADGFTLLELVIISIVVGVLAAIAAPSFFGYLNRQELNAAQQELLQQIRQAQSEAKRRQETYQLSLTTLNQGGENLVAVAVHPASLVGMGECVLDPAGPDGGRYQVLRNNPEVEIDNVNSTIGNGDTTCGADSEEFRQRFNAKGEARVDGFGTGTATLQLNSTPQIKRCVIVSTILGALRTDMGDDC